VPVKTRLKAKAYTFGTCSFAKMSPPRSQLSSETKGVNVFLTFDEALKLNIAIDECVRRLNSYNRATTGGKSVALVLTMFLGKNRITVNQGGL